jgi:mono/diheme cytochrome c family protein
MYIRTQRLSHAPIALLMLVATCALATTCCIAGEPPIFSPPTQGGALAPRGHFVQSDGAALYRAICQGCHMPDARGARGAGMYPALAANPKLASAAYPALTVLRGRRGMPGFADSLSDDQVAEVVNYVRSHFDNHFADRVTPGDVARLRASLTSAGTSP